MFRVAAAVVSAIAVILVALGLAAAADYPTRTVTLVVPYPPGGGVDAMARIVAEKLSDALHQQVIVDNRPAPAARRHARGDAGRARRLHAVARPHRHDLDQSQPLRSMPAIDPRKDFAPIGLIASMPVALLAHPSFPAKTVGRSRSRSRRKIRANSISARRRSAPAAISPPSISSRSPASMLTIMPYKGTGAADERPARRPCAGRVRRAAAGDGQYPGRQAARHRGDRARSASACCPTCRPPTNPACRASNPCCITDCWRPPARRARSSTSSTRNCASWSTPTRSRSASTIEGGDPLTSTPGRIRRRHRQGRNEVGRR